MQVLARLLIAATCVCLAACKSDAEKAQTTVLYSTALQEQARALPTTKLRQPQTEEAWRRFERACAQLVLIGSPSSMCEAASKAGVFEPGWPVFAAEEKLAWEALGEDQDRQTYQLKIGDELEHLRTLLANRLTADHWRWTAEVQANRDNMNTVILAGMNKSFQTRAFPDLPLSELNDAQLDALKLRLRQEGTLLAAIGRAGDKFHDETVSSIDQWSNRIEAAIAAKESAATLRAEIVAKADNDAWTAAAKNRLQPSYKDGLSDVSVADTQSIAAPFEKFSAQARTFGSIRAFVRVDGDATLNALTPSAAQYLVDDCTALLELDESAFDKVCTIVAPTVSTALRILNAGANSHRTIDSPPDTPGGPLPGVGTQAADSTSLRQLLRPRVPDPALQTTVPDSVKQALVESLRASIAKTSKAFAEASYYGYFEGVVRVEGRLEILHEALRTAVGGALPDRLSDPLSLLSQNDARLALAETQRLQGILNRTRALLPDVPEYEIASQTLAKRSERLGLIVANPATKSDLAQVVRQLDPAKVKDLHSQVEAQFIKVASHRFRLWADQFAGLPVVFDEWKGPRGPPVADRNYPRSFRVLEAIKELGRNPTRAIRSFAALRAEHVEFYRSIDSEGGELVKQWQFGRKNPRAWMIALMSQRDLAVASAHLRNIKSLGPTVQITDEWLHLKDAASGLHDAIVEECATRTGGSGKPRPGYPPGRPPSVRLAAERYMLDWSQRPASTIEQQLRLQIARQMLGDVIAMPQALRDEVRAMVDGLLDAEVSKLKGMLASIYGTDGQAGLLERAARLPDRLSDMELTAATTARDKAYDAAKIVAARVAAAERDGLVPVSPDRWAVIRTWFAKHGEDLPPKEGVAPGPKLKPGAGGAIFLFADAGLESSFTALEEAFATVEQGLKRAEPVLARAINPPLVGSQQGRAAVKRTAWSNGEFDFARMSKLQGNRYPDKLREWGGFFEKNGKPFDYVKYVKNFSNFRGVGGGVHLGETAVVEQTVSDRIAKGALLSYNVDTKQVQLKLLSGEVFSYGPIEPRVLKALYTYVTAYPGINLAVSIGAAGEGESGRDQTGSTVLLDPRFVDTKVGQDLYLADTIPWSLDKPALPNGRPNPASKRFGEALASYRLQRDQLNTGIEKLIEGVIPLGSTSAADWRELINGKDENASLLAIVAVAVDWPSLVKLYVDARMDRVLEEEVGVELKNVEQLATQIRMAGFDADDVQGAINILEGQPSYLKPSNKKAGTLVSNLQGTKGDKLMVLRQVFQFLRYGETGARAELQRSLSPAVRKMLQESLEKYASGDLYFLRTETDRAKRALRVAFLAAKQEKLRNEISISKEGLRLLASALLELSQQEGRRSSPTQIAPELPSMFGPSLTLATLFDDKVLMSLQDGAIRLDAKMRYQYGTGAVSVNSDALVLEIDGDDGTRPKKARLLTELADAANSHFEQLAGSFPPLADVQKHAAVAAFLRWAACSRTINDICAAHNGLTIDLSALGAFDLRDRNRTPTPDLDAR